MSWHCKGIWKVRHRSSKVDQETRGHEFHHQKVVCRRCRLRALPWTRDFLSPRGKFVEFQEKFKKTTQRLFSYSENNSFNETTPLFVVVKHLDVCTYLCNNENYFVFLAISSTIFHSFDWFISICYKNHHLILLIQLLLYLLVFHIFNCLIDPKGILKLK